MRVAALIRRAQHEAEWRAVDPLVVTCHDDVWYFVGVCAERQNVHAFDLNDIEDVSLLDQPAKPPDVLDARQPAW
jgi:predicted DNA-binding transcriptional regulator YafY